jgi:hypothetical protein
MAPFVLPQVIALAPEEYCISGGAFGVACGFAQ